jgi:hypothetical protein
VKEYELYVPLTYNDGSPIEGEKLVRVRDRLLEQFGSLTLCRRNTKVSGGQAGLPTATGSLFTG